MVVCGGAGAGVVRAGALHRRTARCTHRGAAHPARHRPHAHAGPVPAERDLAAAAAVARRCALRGGRPREAFVAIAEAVKQAAMGVDGWTMQA